MNICVIRIIPLFFAALIVLTTGCTMQSPKEVLEQNVSSLEMPATRSNPPPMETIVTTRPPPATTIATLPVTYSVSNPLEKDDYYRFTSGENEIIARFVQYEITDNYGELSEAGTAEYLFPDRIHHALKGTRYLFVYFTFSNLGKKPAVMPGAEMISIITENGTYTYPDNSLIPKFSSHGLIITQVNGTRKNMHKLDAYTPNFRLPVGRVFSDDWSWYVPFIVPDTFDPHKSFISFKLDNTSYATWKFV